MKGISPELRKRCGEILRFVIGGVSTTVISYVVYLLLLPHVAYFVAYTLAYALGIAWSYFANTLFVFRRRPSFTRALTFPIVYAVQYLIGSLLLVALIRQLQFPKELAPLAVVVATLPITYVLSRWIITAKH